MSRSTISTATATLDHDLYSALLVALALRLILFELEGDGLTDDARRAAGELAFTVERRLISAQAAFDLAEKHRRAGGPPPVKAGRA